MAIRKERVVVIRESFVKLTGDASGISAAILNQFLYWTERTGDEMLMKEIEALEKEGKIEEAEEKRQNLRDGWIWKSAKDLQEELMISSHKTIERRLKELVQKGFLLRRTNPKFNWDKTYQYKVNLEFIQAELHKLGYTLEGYTLPNPLKSPNRQFDESKGHGVPSNGQDDECNGQDDEWNGQNDASIGQDDESIRHSDDAIPKTTTETTPEITTETTYINQQPQGNEPPKGNEQPKKKEVVVVKLTEEDRQLIQENFQACFNQVLTNYQLDKLVDATVQGLKKVYAEGEEITPNDVVARIFQVIIDVKENASPESPFAYCYSALANNYVWDKSKKREQVQSPVGFTTYNWVANQG